MIDENKLIEDIEKEIEFAMKCNMPAMVAGMRQIASIIENQPKIGEWIPCSERFPEESGTYIVNAIENHIVHVTFAKWMPRMKRWNLSGNRSYWKVTAWMPLPEPHRPEKESE